MSLRIKIFSNHISIGNQLLFTPFLRALRHDLPDTYITTNSPVMMELIPELFDEFDSKADNAIVVLPLYHVCLKAKLKGMKTHGFQYRIKGHFVNLFIDRSLKWDWSLHEVDNNRQFLNMFDITDKAFTLELKPSFKLSKPGNLIGVHPGGRFDKRWPIKYFAQVCDLLIERGHKVALFGGPEEKELTRKVRSQMKHEVYADYGGMSTLSGVIALLDTCDFVFANDGGLMHIASALQKPVTAIFGPTDFVKNGPYNSPHWIIVNEIECRPCYHFSIINCTNFHKFACLETLSVKQVFSKLEEAIDNYMK